jgi:hypothetical protein
MSFDFMETFPPLGFRSDMDIGNQKLLHELTRKRRYNYCAYDHEVASRREGKSRLTILSERPTVSTEENQVRKTHEPRL